MTGRLLSPTLVSAWLDCPHSLTLERLVADGQMTAPAVDFGSMARLVMDTGLEHERQVRDRFTAEGLVVVDAPGRDLAAGETFEQWAARAGRILAGTCTEELPDVIAQLPLAHDAMRGIADFVIRVDHADGHHWEPVDAKLARTEAAVGHLMQLCFYADALEALTGTTPEQVHLELGSGQRRSFRLVEVRSYWDRQRRQLAIELAGPPRTDTRPEPCAHCEFCAFAGHCESEWRNADATVHIAGIRTADRHALEQAGVGTIAALADLADLHGAEPAPVIDGVTPERLDVLTDQAALQVEARTRPDEIPPHRLLDDPEQRGLLGLPAPDPGDVFFDIEGHPFWRPDRGLVFLFGLLERDGGTWAYRTWWAHDPAEEAAAVASLLGYLTTRRAMHPGMHVYHYNHTERSALARLTVEHGVREVALMELVHAGVFVDLRETVRHALRAGVESYGLKSIEQLAGFERNHDIESGSGAVIGYARWLADGDQAELDRIEVYNRDDVAALVALRDWLVALRPADTPWAEAPVPDEEAETDERIEQLHAFGPDTPQHLLGDLLLYWRREARAAYAEMLVRLDAPLADQLDQPDTIAGLRCVGEAERIAKNGRTLAPGLRFRFDPQTLNRDLLNGVTDGRARFRTPDGLGYAALDSIDATAGELVLFSKDGLTDVDPPTAITIDDQISAKVKWEALCELADRLLDSNGDLPEPEAWWDLLRRTAPRFTPGSGPAADGFGTELADLCRHAVGLDDSWLAIQGPPGTGKTWTGARLIRELVRSGKRVGITAFSHTAIDNLLGEVAEVFAEAGEPVRIGRQKGGGPPPAGVQVADNAELATGPFDVVAGTTWAFSSTALRATPVDVLVIDEAGQLGLADALAASGSARSVVLLGDPQQLPQVTIASHPNGAGASILEHLLDGEPTVPEHLGVFLDVTRRMHPDVCRFISEQFYEGRLDAHDQCGRQDTDLGTGLRWVRAHHTGRSTESPEEAELVVGIARDLLGRRWTDASGSDRPLGPADIIVVAPYNDQVNLVREHLARDPQTAAVRVGTVDKFQGQEAAAVIFTMATSTAADMPRDLSFLFSRNRLNVALSRARCLAHLVCTDELLDTRAGTVEGVRQISAVCAAVATAANPVPAPSATEVPA